MTEDLALEIHLTLPEAEESATETLRKSLEARCRVLAGEFPELTHLEVRITEDGAGYEASAHATGRRTEVASHASASEPEPTADLLLDTLRQQLRRTHDKRIFTHRRDAKLHSPKRS